MVVFFAKPCNPCDRQAMVDLLCFGGRSVGYFCLVLMLLLGLAGCTEGGYQGLSGSTMGTYYRIQANCPVQLKASDIDERLRRFNLVFSTYDPASELSQLNLAQINQWRETPPELMRVLLAAAHLKEESRGAFDPTIGALVRLWGFGPGNPQKEPDPADIAAARARTGFSVVQLDPGIPALRSAESREFDLSAVAKGRAVDELSKSLEQLKCSAALVDIGGEIRVFGPSPSKRAWRLAIEQPGELSDGADALPVLAISEGAVATSGDYRNYRELDGQRLSHLLDPRTARPIAHGLASVTVWHPEAMWADGYVTAINVLGPEQGQELSNRAKLAVAMLIRTDDGRFRPWMSDAFEARFVSRD